MNTLIQLIRKEVIKLLKFVSCTSILLSSPAWSVAQKLIVRVQSPDKQTEASFSVDQRGKLFYQLTFGNQTIIKSSRLGIKTNGPSLDSLIQIQSVEKKKVNEKFDWPIGEDAQLVNNYNEVTIHCSNSYDVIARIYNGSLAFRYASRKMPKQSVRLITELTEFNLARDYRIYQYHEESVFRALPLVEFNGISDLPSTLVATGGSGYVSIGEAENRNYTKCVLISGELPNSLKLHFYVDTLYRNHEVASIQKDTLVIFRDSLISPWRTINCSKTAIGLHDFSQLNLKLVTPISNEIPSYVKPGKVFRVPITTKGALDGVDFAAKMNFQYILIDAGWYGAEFRTTSDPTKYTPDFDLPGIIAHGKQKGIGVILYVNYVGLKAKIDTILPLYKKWGVSGIKFGFVDGGTQKGLAWLDTAMKKVNDYGFILNVHDHYKPTGLSRRYPFQVSQEGIRGDENSPDAFHNTVLPFTRYLAGPADFTFCFPNKFNAFSKNVKVSKGQQLALTVIYFDPLQAIFWYGRSQDYQDDPEVDFFRYVPTVWDESHYLAGEIGEGITVARRKGDTWYLGSAAGLEPWNTSFKLDFLDKHKNYVASIYEDDGKGAVSTKNVSVKYNQLFNIALNGKEGQAIIIRPEK